MKKIPLNIIALANSESQPGYFTIVFEEVGGNRRIPMIIGAYEAQAIALSMENQVSAQPLSYDLLKSVLETSAVKIIEVVISDIVDGMFQTALVGLKPNGVPFAVGARSADAVALALRLDIPIFTVEKVIDIVGVPVNDSGKVLQLNHKNLAEHSLVELEGLLDNVLAVEDYERACQIRDMIQKRKALNDKRA